MNERLAYEELIAAKLEQLAPLPAMADAIWSRISDELDREMPNDDGGAPDGGGGSALPGSGGFAWPGLGLIILAAAGLLYWNSQRKSAPAITPTLPGASVQPKPATVDSSPPESSAPFNSGAKPVGNQQPVTEAAVADTTSVVDDNSTLGVLKPDTGINRIFPATSQPNLNLQQPNLVPNEKQSAPAITDTPPPKKSRGVTGINNNDYRIVPDRKDTSRKKN